LPVQASPLPRQTQGVDPVLEQAHRQLDDYFLGRRRAFDLPLSYAGTAFQNRVWAALQTIPYGTTLSYVELAYQINQPKAARAVGAANGKNPLCLVIPCHRVVAANGNLGGYSGGIEAKQWLLSHEA
jgi:methylated-DNA-[protein]-cysteine S-methyltransferase